MIRQSLSVVACLILAACGNDAPAARGPVVFMGDSITAAWDSVPPVDSRIAVLVPGSIDAGVGGNTSADMLARFQTDALAYHPSVIVILAGTNDMHLIQGATIDAVASMADQAAAHGVPVILSTVPPGELYNFNGTFLTEADTRPAIQTWNTQLKLLAASHGYQIADYYSAMVNPDGSQNLAFFDAGGIHPNSAGYAAMWAVLAPVLATDG